jgi:hypothetical protein
MLYWAEGAKSRNTVKFVNSDPQMVWFFRRFLTEALAVDVDKIAMTLNVYTTNGLTIEEIERTGSSCSNFRTAPSASTRSTTCLLPVAGRLRTSCRSASVR